MRSRFAVCLVGLTCVALGTASCTQRPSAGGAGSSSASARHLSSGAPSAAAAKPGQKVALTAHLEHGFQGAEGVQLSFADGRAVIRPDGIALVFSTGPIGCNLAAVQGQTRLLLTIPPGPGSAFFAGAGPMGVPIEIESATPLKNKAIRAPFANVTLSAVGDRVTGEIDFDDRWNEAQYGPKDGALQYSGHGTFDVELCGGAAALPKPQTRPQAPRNALMGGRFGGKPLAPRSVLAVVRRDPWTQKWYLGELLFYDVAGVTCATSAKTNKTAPRLVLAELGGSGKQRPAEPSIWSPSKATTGEAVVFRPQGAWAWVELGEQSIETAAIIDGAAYIESPGIIAGRPDMIDGTFHATVCKVEGPGPDQPGPS